MAQIRLSKMEAWDGAPPDASLLYIVVDGASYKVEFSTLVDAIGGGDVPSTRTISAGTGLTGGGDLSSNRTLSLAAIGSAGSGSVLTYDIYGRVTGSATLTLSDLPTGLVRETRKLIGDDGIDISNGGVLDSDLIITIGTTGVVAGTFYKVTTNSQGRVEAGETSLTLSDMPAGLALSATKVTAGSGITINGGASADLSGDLTIAATGGGGSSGKLTSSDTTHLTINGGTSTAMSSDITIDVGTSVVLNSRKLTSSDSTHITVNGAASGTLASDLTIDLGSSVVLNSRKLLSSDSTRLTVNAGTSTTLAGDVSLDLGPSGVTAGSYSYLTVDKYGRATTGSLVTVTAGTGVTINGSSSAKLSGDMTIATSGLVAATRVVSTSDSTAISINGGNSVALSSDVTVAIGSTVVRTTRGIISSDSTRLTINGGASSTLAGDISIAVGTSVVLNSRKLTSSDTTKVTINGGSSGTFAADVSVGLGSKVALLDSTNTGDFTLAGTVTVNGTVYVSENVYATYFVGSGSSLTALNMNSAGSGTLALTRGGTGKTSASAAFTNLAPAQSGKSGNFLTSDGTSASWSTDGSSITINAANISSGTISLSRLPNTGTAGTYTKVTTNAQGLVSSGSNLILTDVPGSELYAPIVLGAAPDMTLLWREWVSSNLTSSTPGQFTSVSDTGGTSLLTSFPIGPCGYSVDGSVRAIRTSGGMRRATEAEIAANTNFFTGVVPTTHLAFTAPGSRVIGGFYRFNSGQNMSVGSTIIDLKDSGGLDMAFVTAWHDTTTNLIRLRIETTGAYYEGGSSGGSSNDVAGGLTIPADTWVWIGLVWQFSGSSMNQHQWEGICHVVGEKFPQTFGRRNVDDSTSPYGGYGSPAACLILQKNVADKGVPSGRLGAISAYSFLTPNYTYSTTTSGDPGSGGIRLSSTTLSAVTSVLFDYLDENGTDQQAWITALGATTVLGYLRITKRATPTSYAVYRIVSVADSTGYKTVTVTYVTHSGSFSASDKVVVSYVPYGYPQSRTAGHISPRDMLPPIDEYPTVVVDPVYGADPTSESDSIGMRGPWASLEPLTASGATPYPYSALAIRSSFLIGAYYPWASAAGARAHYDSLPAVQDKREWAEAYCAGGRKPVGPVVRVKAGTTPYRLSGPIMLRAIQGISVIADDPGNRPVVSLAEIIGGTWTQDATYTNTYYSSDTTTVTRSGVWECEAHASAGGSATLYYALDHPPVIEFSVYHGVTLTDTVSIAADGTFTVTSVSHGAGNWLNGAHSIDYATGIITLVWNSNITNGATHIGLLHYVGYVASPDNNITDNGPGSSATTTYTLTNNPVLPGDPIAGDIYHGTTVVSRFSVDPFGILTITLVTTSTTKYVTAASGSTYNRRTKGLKLVWNANPSTNHIVVTSVLRAMQPMRLSNMTDAKVELNSSAYAATGGYLWDSGTNRTYVRKIGGGDPAATQYERWSGVDHGFSGFNCLIKDIICEGGLEYTTTELNSAVNHSPFQVNFDLTHSIIVFDNCLSRRYGKHGFTLIALVNIGLAVFTRCETQSGPVVQITANTTTTNDAWTGYGFIDWSPYVDFAGDINPGELVTYYRDCVDVLNRSVGGSSVPESVEIVSYLSHSAGGLNQFALTVLDSCTFQNMPSGGGEHQNFIVKDTNPTVTGWVDYPDVGDGDTVTLTGNTPPVVYFIDAAGNFSLYLPRVTDKPDGFTSHYYNVGTTLMTVYDQDGATDELYGADTVSVDATRYCEVRRHGRKWHVTAIKRMNDS